MALTPPTVEPLRLQAGDTLNFTRELADFDAGDGWTLTYRAISRLGLDAIDIAAATADDGSGFEVDVPAATTAAWAAGEYTLYGFVTDGTDRYQVYQGKLTIAPDPESVDFVDSRTYLERVLEKLEKVIEEGVIREVIRYSYGGVSTEVQSMRDALDARDRIRAAIAQEQAATTGRQQKILTRFVNPQ
jgi:hypothetical protein